MEVWLGTDNNKIRFPVTPSEPGINRSADIGTENIIKFGEIPIFNGMKLKTAEISSFFPNRKYSFCTYKDFMSPDEFSQKIQKWMYSGEIVRFIVTGTTTNLLCRISDFNTVPEKGTGDIYFDLSLLEYKALDIPIIQDNPSDNTTRPVENQNNQTQRTHKVIKGDNLYDIAQKYYGNGKLYTRIKEANWYTYPELKTSNIIYTKMTLVIP